MTRDREPTVTGVSPAVSIRDVVFRYGAAAPALDGVSATIAAGSVVALLGPNGSGKSTLLRLLGQSAAPTSGSVELFGGANAARDDGSLRARIGVVFQSPSLDPRLGVAENLAIHAALHGLSRDDARARIDTLLAEHGLASRAQDRVETLSGGLARRVDLVRSVLHRPELLLLDEPTTGLDPPSRAAFLDAVFAERDRSGTTVILSTHLVDEANRCDRVILLHRGRIVADGEPVALRAALGPRRIVVHGLDAPSTTEMGASSIEWTRRAEGWTTLLADEREATTLVSALIARGRSFTVGPPTLADLFARTTGEELASASPEPESSSRGRTRRGGRHG